MKGRVALITGANRGLGRAMALEFAARGADIAVNYTAIEDRNEHDADAVVAACKDLGVKAMKFEADVTDPDACCQMSIDIPAKLGPVSILVNNAGILRDRTFRKITEDEWNAVIAVNLTGAFNVSKAIVPGMVEQGYGRLLFLSSVIGVTGGFGQTNYAASKAGLIGFAKSLAREVASKGITANCIAPGLIDTEMIAGIPDQSREAYLKQIPVGRLGHPEEIAKLAAFLASSEAAYITGQVVNINGGLYM